MALWWIYNERYESFLSKGLWFVNVPNKRCYNGLLKYIAKVDGFDNDLFMTKVQAFYVHSLKVLWPEVMLIAVLFLPERVTAPISAIKNCYFNLT